MQYPVNSDRGSLWNIATGGDRMENYVITIARGFGSGGKKIAMRLAAELGINCYENRILTLASQMTGIDESVFCEVDEKIRGNFLTGFLKGLPARISPRIEEHDFLSDDRLFQYQKQIIEKLAETESCVIVGKCADWLLRDRDNVASFYIEAPREYCRPRIMSQLGISAEEADRAIARTDKYRADYYEYYTGGNYWTNPINYDMTLNSARVGEENCVRIIRDYVKMKFGQ